jgi:hypothetical protein
VLWGSLIAAALWIVYGKQEMTEFSGILRVYHLILCTLLFSIYLPFGQVVCSCLLQLSVFFYIIIILLIITVIKVKFEIYE